MAPADARRLLGPDAIIGLTINSPQRADATDLSLIDYAGIGGVYGTTSKQTKNSPIGIAGMARVIEALHRRKSEFLTCGIAGINAANAAPVIEAGADGVSVISALSMVKDPKAATAELPGLSGRLLMRERWARGVRASAPRLQPVRLRRGQRGHVDDAARGDARYQHVDRPRHAQQDRADLQPLGRGLQAHRRPDSKASA